MSDVQIKEDISIREYFEQVLPRLFEEYIKANPPKELEGEKFPVNYIIDDQQYGVVISDGNKIELKPGGLEKSLITVSMNEKDWRDVTTGKVQLPNTILLYNTRKHVDKLKNFKGVFKLRLTKEDGSNFLTTTVFNGSREPEVTLIGKAQDYAQMLQGKLNPQMALMTGRIKFEGSLPFLLLLGSLNQ